MKRISIITNISWSKDLPILIVMSIETYVDSVIIPHIRSILIADIKQALLIQPTISVVNHPNLITIIVDNKDNFLVVSNKPLPFLMTKYEGKEEHNGWRFNKNKWDTVLNLLKSNHLMFEIKNTLKTQDNSLRKIAENRWVNIDTNLVLEKVSGDDNKGVIIGKLNNLNEVIPLTLNDIEYCKNKRLRYLEQKTAINELEESPNDNISSSLID